MRALDRHPRYKGLCEASASNARWSTSRNHILPRSRQDFSFNLWCPEFVHDEVLTVDESFSEVWEGPEAVQEVLVPNDHASTPSSSTRSKKKSTAKQVAPKVKAEALGSSSESEAYSPRPEAAPKVRNILYFMFTTS